MDPVPIEPLVDHGVRLEADQVDGHDLMGFRFIDYHYRFGEHFALGGLLGVARYDLATPAYSLYASIGTQWRNVLPGWDLGVDARHAQNVARNRVLESDISWPRPDSLCKIERLLFYSRGFLKRFFSPPDSNYLS